MSYDKGYNPENIDNFLETYNCKRITPNECLDYEKKTLRIISFCGHESNVTFRNLLKNKNGIYCEKCMKEMTEVKCFKCQKMFASTKKSFLFCSESCRHSKKVTDETKKKIQESVLRTIPIYNNDDGTLKSYDEIVKIRKNKKRPVIDISSDDESLNTSSNLSSNLSSNSSENAQINTSTNSSMEMENLPTIIETMTDTTDTTTDTISGINEETNVEINYNQSDLSDQPTTQIKKKRRLIKYQTIKNDFEAKECTLITTKEQFLEKKRDTLLKNIVFDVMAPCGHPTTVFYYSFLNRNTELLCKKCANKKLINMMRLYAKSRLNGFDCSTSLLMQNKGLNILREKCNGSLEILKTRDGCKSNVLVRPLVRREDENDEWLNIKLKVKADNANKYTGFRIKKIYDGVVIIMMYLDTQKSWIFRPEELEKKTYKMGKILDPFENKLINDFSETLINIFNEKKYNLSFDESNTPISNGEKLEYEYVKKREETIKFLKFKKNDVSNLVFNFKIDNLKVQEKTLSKQKDRNSRIASLCKKRGRYIRDPYFVGDNDIYWFNINDSSNDFYVVPEYELLRRNYIADNTSEGKRYFNVTYRNSKWLIPYKFNYETINEPQERERLENLIRQIKYFCYVVSNSLQLSTLEMSVMFPTLSTDDVSDSNNAISNNSNEPTYLTNLNDSMEWSNSLI